MVFVFDILKYIEFINNKSFSLILIFTYNNQY